MPPPDHLLARPFLNERLLTFFSLSPTCVRTLPPSLFLCVIAERMEDELDFRAEATSMDKINDLLQRKPDGTKRYKPFLHTPRSVKGMVTKRVLVMDYLDGKTLTQIGEEAREKGESNEVLAKLIGEKLVGALTRGFGQMVLQGGLFHGDPHPGNIMVLNNGDIALLDFGQTKQLSSRLQSQLASLCVLLEGEGAKDYEAIADVVAEMGVKLTPTADKQALSACAVWMFDSLSPMPGNYSADEFSENSPVRDIASFPQDLVMVGRAAVLIRGICAFFSIPWSVSRAWAPLARWKLHGTPLEEKGAMQERLFKVKVLCTLALHYTLKVPLRWIRSLWSEFVAWIAQKTTYYRVIN